MKKLFHTTAVQSRLPGKLANTLRDNKGVAAVEFALIAPLLIILFMGTVETSYAVSIDRKISRTASAIADLITQSAELKENDVKQIMTIAPKIMAPYELVPCIVISGIEIKNGKATIAWSRDNSDTSTANCFSKKDATDIARKERVAGSEYPVPASIKIDDTFLIAAEVEADHTPIVGIFGQKNVGVEKDATAITLGDSILLRPRIGDKVTIKP